MARQIVSNYQIVTEVPDGDHKFHGESVAVKPIVFHLFKDNSAPHSLLDIGFGVGGLGKLVRSNPETAHWAVDGIDGCAANCCNQDLFKQGLYRNIWHGLAQELTPEQLDSYDAICLFDVIEHLDENLSKELLRNLLASLREDALLVLSTPLWFYPQDSQNEGDLEEHLIGVPATSMMAMQPIMYSVNYPLVGTFAFRKSSLNHIDRFVPTTDRRFDFERGTQLAQQANMRLESGILYVVDNGS